MQEETNKKLTIQERVKSNNFGFWITVAAVVFQSLHSQYVLKLISSLKDIGGYDLTGWHSFGVAGIISLAILYFTLRGKANIAIGAAIFETYMNICYYVIFISSMEVPNWNLLFIGIPSSIALPSILALFAEEINDNKLKVNQLEEINNDIKELADIQATDRAELLELINTNNIKGKEVSIKVNDKVVKGNIL
jgi:hypothetical protein